MDKNPELRVFEEMAQSILAYFPITKGTRWIWLGNIYTFLTSFFRLIFLLIDRKPGMICRREEEDLTLNFLGPTKVLLGPYI